MTFVRGALKHGCDDCKKMNLFSDKEKYKSGIPLDYDLEYWIKVKKQYSGESVGERRDKKGVEDLKRCLINYSSI